MNLFRKLQTDSKPAPAPAPELSALEKAEAELAASGRQCAEATQRCESLDEEKRSWPARREAAFAAANAAMVRHSKAKTALSRLSEPAPFLRGHGSTSPVAAVTGSVVVIGEN
jgi:hypothetical protein